MTTENINYWPLVRLKEVTVDVPSIDPGKSPDTTFSYIDISSIDNQQCKITETKRIAGSQAPSRARRPVQKDDVLFSNVRTYLRNVALVEETQESTVASTGFTVLRSAAKILPRYLYHLVRSDYFIDQVTPKQTGTHYPATSDSVVRNQIVPLPDLSQQASLVATIDAAEESCSAAKSHLSNSERLILASQEALLDAAFSGRLTADWRSNNKGDIEDGKLPAGWTRATLEELAEPGVTVSYGIVKPGPEVVGGVPYVRQQDIADGTVLVDQLAHTSPEIASKYRRTSLREGDVLLCIIRNLRVAIVPPGIDGANITQGMVRIRPGDRVLSEYLAYYLSAPRTQQRMRDQYVGLAMPRINVRDARALLIDLPPLDEQHEIVNRISTLLSLVDKVKERINRASQHIDRSTQAVVTKALRGELNVAPV